ncbi:hypothetical protein ACQ856_03480 [Mycolicibacterium psychrotolerans]|uniref:hypothetical protein n=1 Tax=Mycolicibacterium psychrotolerans TaxID=216929 RepID=UPI003D673494
MTVNGETSSSDGDETASKLTCFIVCPIGDDRSEIRKRSDQVKKYIIDPAVEPLGYETTRADLTDESGQITTQIVTQLLNADLIIADLTGHNPNVFYELAIRHAFGKPFIQIGDKSERIPFDVAGQWSVLFDHKDLDSADEAKRRINKAAKAIRDGGDDYKMDNPVTQTVDLQQLRSSGNPEQIAMAEISQALTDIRTDIRRTRMVVRTPGGYSADEMSAIRSVFHRIAAEGRLTNADLSLLEAAPAKSKGFIEFLERLQLEHELNKPTSSARRFRTDDDPWNSPPASGFAGGDDEPPF